MSEEREQKEMEQTYVSLDEATGTEAVIDEAGTVVIFGFHDKLNDVKTRVTLNAHEAYHLLQWLFDYHRDFLHALIQQSDRGKTTSS
jgi:ribosomal protein L5